MGKSHGNVQDLGKRGRDFKVGGCLKFAELLPKKNRHERVQGRQRWKRRPCELDLNEDWKVMRRKVHYAHILSFLCQDRAARIQRLREEERRLAEQGANSVYFTILLKSFHGIFSQSISVKWSNKIGLETNAGSSREGNCWEDAGEFENSRW